MSFRLIRLKVKLWVKRVKYTYFFIQLLFPCNFIKQWKQFNPEIVLPHFGKNEFKFCYNFPVFGLALHWSTYASFYTIWFILCLWARLNDATNYKRPSLAGKSWSLRMHKLIYAMLVLRSMCESPVNSMHIASRISVAPISLYYVRWFSYSLRIARKINVTPCKSLLSNGYLKR